jgi:hypothetical protein
VTPFILLRAKYSMYAFIAAVCALLLSLTGCAGVSSSSSPAPKPTPAPPAAIAITLSATAVTVQAGSTQALTATVANDSQNKGVTWTVSGSGCTGAACGSLSPTSSASGVAVTFTAPPAVPAPAMVTVTATSVADSTKSALAAVTISAPPPAIVVTLSATAANVQPGGMQALTATVSNDSQNKGVVWTVSGSGCTGAACGSVSPASSASGVAVTYTAPPAVPAPAVVTVTATSVSDGTKSATAMITITAPPVISVTVSPATTNVTTQDTQAFTATLANDSQNKGVTWTLTGAGCSGATCGSISPTSSASGAAITYTAPASVPTPAMVTLTATSVADGTKSAAATITIMPVSNITVTLAPVLVNVPTQTTQTFTATVANDTQNKGVTWQLLGSSCQDTSCGTLSASSSASGVAITYTAPAKVPVPAAVTLRATSVTDTTKTAAATITITSPVPPNVSVSLTPKRGGITLAQSLDFAATVTNDVNAAGVSWSAVGGGSFLAHSPTSATFVPSTTPGVVTVTATSNVDSTKSASATIGITDLAGVSTYHNDISRDGVNAKEYALTTSNVTAATFGKLFSCTADGAVYAQPLWIPNIRIGGGTHNVIVAATMRDSVYVFDADAAPCVTYWHKQLLPVGETYGSFADIGSSDAYPDIGILGTPVIDASGTIYLVTKSKGATYHLRLHALNLTDGSEKANSPVEIDSSITAPGNCEGGTSIPFHPQVENQRPGLALVNGVVYVSWGSHGDVGTYHGWVVGYATSNLTVSGIFNTSKNAVPPATYCRGGIWMSGGAPAADSANNLFLITGNGVFDGVGSFGDSYLKLTTPGLSVADYFAPHNQSVLDTGNTDLGSSGTALLIDPPTGPKLLVGGSKAGMIYVLDRGNMGHFNSTTDSIVQSFSVTGRSFATPAFWNNTLYHFGAVFKSQQPGQTYPFATSTGMFATTPSASTPSGFGYPGATPSISATPSSTNGIVWAIDASAFGTSDSGSRPGGPAILHAYDASNIANELWNSSQSGTRDTAGNAVKFAVPTVANGKVYIGTRGSDDSQGNGTTFGEIDVYGLLPN